jgi:hypothetical protein
MGQRVESAGLKPEEDQLVNYDYRHELFNGGSILMTLDESYRGLETLGLTDCEARAPKAPEARSYDPPERLRAVLSSVNIGRAGLEQSNRYTVTLQSSQDCEWRIIEGEPMEIKTEFGSACGPILFPMDDALLDA